MTGISPATLAEIRAHVLGCVVDDLVMAQEAEAAYGGNRWDWAPGSTGYSVAGGSIIAVSASLASYLVLQASPRAVRAAALRDRELILLIERGTLRGEAMLRLLLGVLEKYGAHCEGYDPRWKIEIESLLSGPA